MKTILVIEDNPDNMDLMEEILEDAGYGVLKAGLAEEGIRLLRERGADLVLMDISLPRMSGLEATAIIKGDGVLKGIPVVALTAHAMPSDRRAALEGGCEAFLTKPVDEALLMETLERLLG